MKLITSQWDLTAYISLSKYNEQFEYIDAIVTKTEAMCREYMNNPDNNCNNLLYLTNSIIREIQKKKTLVLNSIGHLSKRSTVVGLIGKAAKLLFGICNLECIKKFNFNIELAHNTTQLKLINEQIKIIKLKNEFEAREYYNMTFAVNELINITKEQQLRNYITKHFMIISLTLTKHLSETNTLLEIIQQAKIGVIHPNLITPQEFLEHFKDI